MARRKSIGLAFFTVGILLACCLRPANAQQTLELDVIINGFPSHKIGEFISQNDALSAKPQELKDLGFAVPNDIATAADGNVPLSTLKDLKYRLDQHTQTLFVTTPNDNLSPSLLRAIPEMGVAKIETGVGATIDYDVTGTESLGQSAVSGLFDLRVFSPWGVLSSGLLAIQDFGANYSAPSSFIRLDTGYVYSDPDTMYRYHLGDFITGGLAWTRPVRLGGAQFNSDFSMRPDLITFPLPSFNGSVAVPSTVDVFVNDQRFLSQAVTPGPFAVPSIPVVTGANNVSLAVTNALGKQVTLQLPFYASSALLAPGLQSISIEMGAVRRNWGIVSDDYQQIAASGSYRRGVTSGLTVEAHGEALPNTYLLGMGLAIKVAELAEMQFAGAASGGGAQTGGLVTIRGQRNGRILSFGAAATFTTGGFRDIAAASGDPYPRRQLTANASLALGRFGSLSLAYAGIDLDMSPLPVSFLAVPGSTFGPNQQLPAGYVASSGGVISFVPARHTHVISTTYSIQAHNASFYVTGFHDFVKGGGSGVLVGVTMPLGSRSSISGALNGGSGSPYAQVQAVQTPVSIGDWGYQLNASGVSPAHEFGEVQYRSGWGQFSGGVDRFDQQTTYRGEAQGSISVADGGIFPSNTIIDSFAVVDTNGTANVRVSNENREVGRTSSSGRLLVPDLRSYEANHISIDPDDIPADASIQSVTRDVRPQDRSGIIVRFPIHKSNGALIRFVDDSNHVLPVGSTATLQSGGETVPVGYDGQAYVEGLQAHNTIRLEDPKGRACIASFDYQAAVGEIPAIGPIICRPDGS